MMPYPAEFREPWIDEEGILHFQVGLIWPRVARIVEVFRAARELTADGPLPLIIDGRAMRMAPPPKAWILAVHNLSTIAKAVASLFSDMTPEEVLRYQKGIASLIPSRVFEDEADAIAWLRSFNG